MSAHSRPPAASFLPMSPHHERHATKLRVEPRVSEGTNNTILAGLSHQDLKLLDPSLTRIQLSPGQVIVEAGEPLRDVYYLEGGLTILLTDAKRWHQTQVAMVGRDGAVGLLEFQNGSQTAFATAVSQFGGPAIRAPIHDIPRAARESLCAAGRSFVCSLMQQIMETAGCTASGVVALCAQWLLMAHARMEGGYLPFTGAALAINLGINKGSVYAAIRSLKRRGLIQTGERWIRVRDAEGLRTFVEAFGPTARREGGAGQENRDAQ